VGKKIATFLVLTLNTGHTKWITGEFGCGLVLGGTSAGFLTWRKRAELPHG
jgi:hypothetical protein